MANENLKLSSPVERETYLLGLLGQRLEHTVSPVIHEAAALEMGMDLYYFPFEVEPDDLKQAVLGMKALKFAGANVTIPYKEKVLQYADEMSEVVEFIGAANTLIFRGDKIIAENTDWKGFLRSWEEMGMGSVQGNFAVVIGSGGAADAVLYALVESGLGRVHVFNRNRKRAEKLLDKFTTKYPHLLSESYFLSDETNIAESLKSADILINATPVGMYPYIDDLPIKLRDDINSNLRCYDLVYNPIKSRLVEEMEKRNRKAAGGLGMLIYQAALSFELWTGMEPDLVTMRNAALNALVSGG